jgi:hypothetical protein
MPLEEKTITAESRAQRAPVAMRALALFRIVLGAFAWTAPRTINRIFRVPGNEQSSALIYMNRVFGVRAVSLGVGYLVSRGEARKLWHRLWLLCDAADTLMGSAMAARRELPSITAAQALLITAGATAIDIASLTARADAPETRETEPASDAGTLIDLAGQ